MSYPKYGGRKPTDAYTLSHHLVQLIRLTFLHLFSDMTIFGKSDLLASFDRVLPSLGTANLTPPVPGAAGRSSSRVKLVPAKLMAAPGGLSRDEYWALPAAMMLSQSVVLVEREKHGVEWAQLVRLMTVVDRNPFLCEWDCAQE